MSSVQVLILTLGVCRFTPAVRLLSMCLFEEVDLLSYAHTDRERKRYVCVCACVRV
jgi:hypothetical protein